MNRIACGPPLGPINKGRTVADNHCELLVDGMGNGLLLKAVYPASEECPGCSVYEWRGMRPIGPRALTFAAALQAGSLIEHLEQALG